MKNEDNKVLLVSIDYPPIGGGQGIYCYELLKRLSNASLLTTKAKRTKSDNIYELWLPSLNPVLFCVFSYFYYLFFLKKHKYSIIHGNSINHMLFLVFKNSKIKYITTIHNTYKQRLKAKRSNRFLRLVYPIFIKLEKFVLKRSDAIICVSETTKNSVESITNNKNIFSIENGVDTEKYKPIKKHNDEIFRFLYVGRLEHRKRVLETIKIYQSLIKSDNFHYKTKLIIVGIGPNYKEIQNYIRSENLQNHVKLMGYKNNIGEYYKQSDCLLLLSHGEGLPLVLLEAISSGLSVIVTEDASGESNIIQNTKSGFIVNDKIDQREVKKRMIEVIKERPSIEDFNEFSSNHGWYGVVNKHKQIYNLAEINDL